MAKSLEFLLTLENTKFNRALEASQKRTKQATQKMGSAFEHVNTKLTRLQATATKGIVIGGLAGGAATLAGLYAFKEGMSNAVTEASSLDTATFNLSSSLAAANRQFDVGTMSQWNAGLLELSDSLKIYSEEGLKNAASKTIDMTKRLGLESTQMQKVIQVAGELGAGKFELADSVERVTAALRGEAEASEALGLTLNENYVKAWYESNNATGEAWKKLTDIEKAQARYNVLLEQAEPMIGKAAESISTYGGALDLAQTGITNLETATGSMITQNQFFIEGLKLAAETFNGWADAINTNAPEAREQAKQLAVALLAAGESSLTALDYIYRGGQGAAAVFQLAASNANTVAAAIFKIIEAGTTFTDWLGITTNATEKLWVSSEASSKAAMAFKQMASENFDQMLEGSTKIQAANNALHHFREEMENIPANNMDDIGDGADDVKKSTSDIVTVTGHYTEELKQVNGVWVQQQKEIDTAISKAKKLKDTVNDISPSSYTGMSGGGAVLAMAAGGGIRSAVNGFHFSGYGGGDRPKNLVMAEDGEVMLRKESVRAGGLHAALAFNAGRFDIVMRELSKRFDSGVLKRRFGGGINIPALPQITLPQLMAGGGQVAAAGSGSPINMTVNFAGNVSPFDRATARESARLLLKELERMHRRSS